MLVRSRYRGSLPNLCNTKYYYPELECQKNKYGFNCTETCGHCDVDPKYKSSDNCDDDNGKCVEGCMPGFSGRLCTESKDSFNQRMFYN